MAFSPSPEASHALKAPEAKKLKKRVGKNEVKGFYYHAAEYQRARQKERNGFARIASSIAEPFMIHVRAARLRTEAIHQSGFGGSTVLSNETTKKLLEGKMSDAEKAQFKVTSQSHAVVGKYDVGSQEDQLAARSMLSTIFGNKGNISDTDRALFEKQIDKKDLDKLLATAQENAGDYMSADEIKAKFSDDAMLGGLQTKDQQDHARELARLAWVSTGMTVINMAKYPAIIALLGTANPLGVALAGAALSGAGRASRLLVEGHTFDISKDKGVDISGKTHGLLGKVFSVDWEKDPSTRNIQLLRAAVVGGVLSLAARQFAPEIMQAWNHPNETANDLVNHLPGDGPGLPAGDTHADIIPHVGVKQVDHMGHAGQASPELGAGSSNEHLSSYSHDAKTSFLPDTKHHDWQQLHSYAQKNGNDYSIRLDYQGQDDGGAKHFIDLMMKGTNHGAGTQHVFIENNQTLAISGPHADDPITIYGLKDGQPVPIGTMHSANLAHELGLSNDSMKHFYQLSHAANQGHLWHGTQDASDLQHIMFQRGLYDDGAKGQGLYGVRIGGGYFKDGVFKIGASNHYFNHNLLNNNPIKDYGSPLTGDSDTPFRSALANGPLGGLEGVDNVEDRGLEWLRENVFRDPIVQTLDNATDFGLYRMDDLALFMQQPLPKAFIENPLLIYPYLSIPYLASGVAGYVYGRKRAKNEINKPLRWVARAGEVGLVWALPGAAVGAAVGRLAAYVQQRVQGRKGKGSQEKSPETKPAAPSAPSDSGQAAAQVQATTSQPASNPLPAAQVEAITDAFVEQANKTREALSTAVPSEVESTTTPPGTIQSPASPAPAASVNATAQIGEDEATATPDSAEAEVPVVSSTPEDETQSAIATAPVATGLTNEANPATPEVIESTQQIDEAAPVPEVSTSVSPEKNQIQIIVDAQHALSENPTDEQKAQLYESLKTYPAGRVLQMLEREKRANPSGAIDVETLLPQAVVAASVVDWNLGEGQQAKEQELEPGDFQAISQALFGDTSDEHSRQVRNAYETYQAQNFPPAQKAETSSE